MIEQFIKYKTAGNSSAFGKTNVFFSCLEEDFPRCFEHIAGLILDRFPDIAIWYPTSRPKTCDQEYYDFLREMRIIVIPLTRKYIEADKNFSRDIDLPFAAEQTIPVLPLEEEDGIGYAFSKKCGSFHILSKYVPEDKPNDSYEERIAKFIKSVIAGPALVKRIKEEFDASIFISYRRKNKILVRDLLDLIRADEDFRDVAVWYDAFLTPGENFNEEIETVLNQCNLMAMMVTPELLELPNYIHSIEYPKALGFEKTVLPVEMVPTDPEQFRNFCSSSSDLAPVPTPVKKDEAKTVTDRIKAILASGKIVLKKKGDDPEHLFYIGLAYLSGTDVEPDRELAVSLIKRSAEAGVIEAVEKLISMFTVGEGVARNLRDAEKWQTTLCDILTEKAEDSCTTENLEKLCKALNRLLDIREELADDKNLIADIAQKLVEYAERLRSAGSPEGGRYLLFGYIKQADSLRFNFAEKKEIYLKAVRLCREIIKEDSFVGYKRLLVSLYIDLGEHTADPHPWNWFNKAVELATVLEKEDKSWNTMCAIAQSYLEMACYSAARNIESPSEARRHLGSDPDRMILSYFELAVGYSRMGKTRRDCYQTRLEYSNCIRSLADYYRHYQKDNNTARKKYLEELTELEWLLKYYPSPNVIRRLAVVNMNLGNISEDLRDTPSAKKYFRAMSEYSRQLFEEAKTSDTKTDLVNALNIEKSFYERLGRPDDLREAQELEEEMQRIIKS